MCHTSSVKRVLVRSLRSFHSHMFQTLCYTSPLKLLHLLFANSHFQITEMGGITQPFIVRWIGREFRNMYFRIGRESNPLTLSESFSDGGCSDWFILHWNVPDRPPVKCYQPTYLSWTKNRILYNAGDKIKAEYCILHCFSVNMRLNWKRQS